MASSLHKHVVPLTRNQPNDDVLEDLREASKTDVRSETDHSSVNNHSNQLTLQSKMGTTKEEKE